MIFILGGNGFVGSGFVRHLNAINIPVTVIDRTNYDELIGAECDVFINANGNSKKFLAKDDPKAEFQASVASVRNSLVDFKFKKYVFLSTSDVYPDCSNSDITCEDMLLNVSQQSTYGFHKYIAELCVQHTAKDWLIFRQGGFVGPGLKKNAVFDVINGGKLWVNVESQFQFINTDDSARIIMELVFSHVTNQIFNLTAKGAISVSEIMRLAKVDDLDVDDSPPVHYEISTKKVEQYVILPETFKSVQAFLNSNVKF